VRAKWPGQCRLFHSPELSAIGGRISLLHTASSKSSRGRAVSSGERSRKAAVRDLAASLGKDRVGSCGSMPIAVLTGGATAFGCCFAA
jgi:hypothetical protein